MPPQRQGRHELFPLFLCAALDCPGVIMYDNHKHLNGSVGATDTNRMKNAADWFYHQVYSDEDIVPRKEPVKEKLPSLLRTARSLEGAWQSRESVFLKQARLLANYEDDYDFSGSVLRYYPTYQSLTDQELRGYFSWRTKLRKGQVEKTSLSFAFLYIYELLNQIGADNALDGYRKLTAFREEYGKLDDGILSYLEQWLTDYVIYYDLAPALLEGSSRAAIHKSVAVLEEIQTQSPAAIVEALEQLPLKWLKRSKFYQQHRSDMEAVMIPVLRRVALHCDTRCKNGFVAQYLGSVKKDLTWLFYSAVFCDPLRRQSYHYVVDELCAYHCQNGRWMVEGFFFSHRQCAKLDDLLKAIDCRMRQRLDPKHPIKSQLDTKWVLKIIQEEIDALLARKQAAEAKKITIDRSQLDKIRREAAITQEKLAVEEELEEAPPEAPPIPEPVAPPSEDTPLSPAEYRLLQSLLYGKDLGWVRAEGLMMSVLLDGINEKLYDIFQDTVLDQDAQPIPDYIDELKEMVSP